MKLAYGNLYFRKINKNNVQYNYLNDNINADILVIGGGITGAVTAYYMAEEGYDVVLVDKNIIGYGSTSANVGILDTQLAFETNKMSKIIGEKNTKRCFNLLLSSIGEINNIVQKLDNKENIGFKRCNSICYTSKYMNKGSIVKEHNSKETLGIISEIISENALLDLRCGIEIKNGSAVINPYEFTKELISYLSKKENVKIYENTEIININSKEEHVLATTNNNFKIKASKVIITEGAEVAKYFPDIPIELYKSYSVVTEKTDGLKDFDTNFTATDVDESSTYIRFTDDGRIILGRASIKGYGQGNE